jgi:hypothetical protein
LWHPKDINTILDENIISWVKNKKEVVFVAFPGTTGEFFLTNFIQVIQTNKLD